MAACRELDASILAMRSFSERHGEDVWFTQAGCLQVATSPAQVGAWRDDVRACRKLGVGEEYVELSAEEVRARCDSPTFLGGACMRVGATATKKRWRSSHSAARSKAKPIHGAAANRRSPDSPQR